MSLKNNFFFFALNIECGIFSLKIFVKMIDELYSSSIIFCLWRIEFFFFLEEIYSLRTGICRECYTDRVGEWYAFLTRSVSTTLHNYRQGRFPRHCMFKSLATAASTNTNITYTDRHTDHYQLTYSFLLNSF